MADKCFEYVIQRGHNKPEFYATDYFEIAIMNTRTMVKMARRDGYSIEWRIVRRDGAIIAQSK